MPGYIDILDHTSCEPALAKDDMLCQLCRKVVHEIETRSFHRQIRDAAAPDIPYFWLWWHDLAELTFCAGLGCRLCGFVMAHRPNSHARQMSDWDSNTFAIGVDPDLHMADGSGRMRFYQPGVKQRREDVKACSLDALSEAALEYLCFEMLRYAPIKEDEPQPFDIGSSTASDQTINRISQWIDICKKHKRCNEWRAVSSRDPEFSPTRLLRIDGTAAYPCVKLLDRADVPPRPVYATLSHCWGNASFDKLLKSNLHSYYNNVPWTSLSRTFQESITAALRLGFQHIWIDALCIVQDDENDWGNEARSMAIVYTNSALNISAHASSDGNGGLFRHRNLVEAGFFEVALQQRAAGMRALRFYHDDWPTQVESSHLSERAWVVQERFLAPRLLHCGSSQVYWECIEMTKLESLPPDVPYSPHFGFYIQAYRMRDQARGFSSRQSFEIWKHLLCSYSGSSLTMASDRPVAMLGFAKAYMDLCGWQESDFLYGLWKPQLVHLLLWQRACSTTFAVGREQFPSWSWLSINRCVVIMEVEREEFLQELASVVDISLPSITVRGPLCRVEVFPDRPCLPSGADREPKWLLRVGTTQLREREHIHLVLDNKPELGNNASMEAFVLLVRAACTDPQQSTADDANTQGGVISSITGHHEPGAEHSEKPVFYDGNYECLLLRSAALPGHFHRIGYVGAAYLADEPIFACCTFDKQFQSPDISQGFYHEVDDDFMYTISLI